jgi:transcriptional antiterminator RfaH
MSINTGNGLRWYVVHTNPKQEGRVESNLVAWEVETFNPLMKVRRKGVYAQGTSIRPMFPRYLFARFDANNLFGKVRFTRGVHCVVSFGRGPTPVGDDVIELLRSRLGKDGFVDTQEEFKPGDKIRIVSGPLSGMVGIFEQYVSDSRRVMMLLNAMSYQARITTEMGSVTKAN